MATNIQVCCRFRPAANNELATAAKRCVKVDLMKGSVALLADQAQLSGDDAAGKAGGLSFNFDAVFDSDSKQEYVFDRIAKPFVQDIFAGYNTTIFACQPTGRTTQRCRIAHHSSARVHHCLPLTACSIMCVLRVFRPQMAKQGVAKLTQ